MKKLNKELIYKQDVINIIKNLPKWIINPDEKFQSINANIMSMIDPEDAVSAIENLQPITDGDITCKDCKWWTDRYNLKLGQGKCILFGIYPKGNDHCKMAERKEE